MLSSAIADAITRATGHAFSVSVLTPIGGGDINQAFSIDSGARRYFVKTNRADRLPMFDAEVAAMRALAVTRSVRVPEPLCAGTAAGQAFLVLEYLDLRGHGDAARLGEQLAALHRARRAAPRQAQFGWGTTTGSAARRKPMPGVTAG